MKDEFAAIADAMDKKTGGGRDAAKARQLADAYVAANPGEFSSYEGKSERELVQAVDVFRAAGMDDDMWRVKTWLLHQFEPQNIGGEAQSRVRVVPAAPTGKTK